MIELWFALSLFDYEIQDFDGPVGPLFHRWMPAGEEDAISIPVSEPANSIRIWFERRGDISHHGFWTYDADKKGGIGSELLLRQTKVNAGFLFGRAVFTGVSQEELQALGGNEIGADSYVALGKRVVGFLAPPLIAFADLLRARDTRFPKNSRASRHAVARLRGNVLSARIARVATRGLDVLPKGPWRRCRR